MNYEQLELQLESKAPELPELFDNLMLGMKKLEGHLDAVDRELDWLFEQLGAERSKKTPPLKVPTAKAEEGVDLTLEQILDMARTEGNRLYLDCPKLKRDCYTKVDNLIRLLGGKWHGGKIQAHVFKSDSRPILDQYRETGELPDLNPLAYFATKPQIAKKLVSWIREENASHILDADAGTGVLASACRERFPNAVIHLVECDRDRATILKQNPRLGETFEEDFLQYQGSDYTTVILNPPFALKEDRKAYITHILKAWDCLGVGQLIAIAPLGFTFSQDSRSREFFDFVNQYGSYEQLPPKSFEGTEVLAVAVYLNK